MTLSPFAFGVMVFVHGGNGYFLPPTLSLHDCIGL